MKPEEYIKRLEEENPIEDRPWEPGGDSSLKGQKITNDTHRSKTDPDARLSRKSSTKATDLCHAATYIMNNKNRIIGILGTPYLILLTVMAQQIKPILEAIREKGS